MDFYKKFKMAATATTANYIFHYIWKNILPTKVKLTFLYTRTIFYLFEISTQQKSLEFQDGRHRHYGNSLFLS